MLGGLPLQPGQVDCPQLMRERGLWTPVPVLAGIELTFFSVAAVFLI